MKIFNSYTNSLETFVPYHEGQVSMYVCGPTVYNYIHIGNARPVVFFDVVRRYFEAIGFTVKFVSNFTDVDDKIIQKAISEGVSELDVSNRFIAAFLADVEKLGSKTDYIKPRVTEYMPQIIAYIQEMVNKGFAYIVDGDVFFSVDKIPEYGKLSNRKLDDLLSGSRIEVNDKKKNPLDFVLWKRTVEGVHWNSPFSVGRPGWHTECVTMIDDIFSEEIDIHGGGIDIMFPHHENEIAQSLACKGHRCANIWMHNGRLNLEGEKMSKSEGNVVWVKDLSVDPMAFRMFLLSTHYRAPIAYSQDSLDSYVNEWQRLKKSVIGIFVTLDYNSVYHINCEITDPDITAIISAFTESMENDFNTANALTAVNQALKIINNLMRQKTDYERMNQILKAMNYMLMILGLSIDQVPLTANDKDLLARWEAARKAKDFQLADVLRNELAHKNLV
ncbi:MAG: cysteine--tRNA ligase [Candidatus Izemoplasmatales bacterium]|nr:cysteine--tRNA ligase [Candidatus Izemoplasmatales bacterium]MDD4595649.1 cysteine--tRNA ligase [Candidatus Izemoplasmatales bacterium]